MKLALLKPIWWKEIFRELEFSRNTVVIGSKLADKLEVNLGDSVDVSFPNANPLSLRVVGIFHTGSPLDESLTYTSLDTAQEFYNVPDVVNGISVRLDNFNRDREVAAEIKKTGYKAKGWTETNPAILRTIAVESTSNNVVLGLIVVIASFGVVSTLNLSVIGATSQIGMLRAMGATVIKYPNNLHSSERDSRSAGSPCRYSHRSCNIPRNRPV